MPEQYVTSRIAAAIAKFESVDNLKMLLLRAQVANPELPKALEEMGHKLAPTSDFTAAAGGMQAIVIDLAKGTMLAGADPRRTGYAVGW